MAQQGGTVNFVIQDTNGNPQYIKVQKTSTTKTLKPVPPDAVKALLAQKGGVTQVVNAATGAVLSPGSQLLRALVPGTAKPRQLVTIPVQTPIHNLMKSDRPVVTRPVPSATVVMEPTHKTVSVADSNTNKRKQDSENDFLPDYTIAKRRKSDKCGKGLRHFSMKVCEKVRKKGVTSYNEVADELVAEFTNPNFAPHSVDQQYDQKNIRRRVYDALNVLMAMNIISKEKKEIRWLGLPTTTAQECVSLISEKNEIIERIKKKTQQLNELILQQLSYKNLVQRNYELEKIRGPPPANSSIQLPFIVVNSDRKTVIDCSISNDKTEYLFVFNDKFEIHDDYEVLKQIGLTLGLEKGAISEADLCKVKSMLPQSLLKYVKFMAEGKMQGDIDIEPEPEFVECAGPSSDGGAPSVEDPDSTVDETSDEESNISTDAEAI